ncbi:hypothetical protein CROQUDRAFT_32091, partial [Cronartium quercuum f. sp. fusiforme G11]
WAINLHKQLAGAIESLDQLISPPCESVGQLLSHSSLATLPNNECQVTAARVLIHMHFTQHLLLQQWWNTNVLQVFDHTQPQDGDDELKQLWNTQVEKLTHHQKSSKLSMMYGFLV